MCSRKCWTSWRQSMTWWGSARIRCSKRRPRISTWRYSSRQGPWSLPPTHTEGYTPLCSTILTLLSSSPQKMDKNKDGVVTIDEFIDCCQNVRDVFSESALKRGFSILLWSVNSVLLLIPIKIIGGGLLFWLPSLNKVALSLLWSWNQALWWEYARKATWRFLRKVSNSEQHMCLYVYMHMCLYISVVFALHDCLWFQCIVIYNLTCDLMSCDFILQDDNIMRSMHLFENVI